MPITLLVIIPWTCEADLQLQWPARAHALAMIAALLLAGHLRRWTHYRAVACILAAAQIIFQAGRWAASTSSPGAIAAVVAGFVLLGGGALISWHKQSLLHRLRHRNPQECPDQTGR